MESQRRISDYKKNRFFFAALSRLKGTPDIKIITGLRRSGKSELVRSYIEWLKKNSLDDNVIYIDFYDLKNDELKTYRALYEYVEKNWKAGKNNTLKKAPAIYRQMVNITLKKRLVTSRFFVSV